MSLSLFAQDGTRLQLVQQRLGFLEVGGVEAFGEPAIDFREHGMRLAEGWEELLLPEIAGEDSGPPGRKNPLNKCALSGLLIGLAQPYWPNGNSALSMYFIVFESKVRIDCQSRLPTPCAPLCRASRTDRPDCVADQARLIQ